MNVLMITPNYPSKAFPFAGIFQQMQAKALENLGVRPRIVSPIPYVPAILKKTRPRYKCMAEIPHHSWDGSIEVIHPRYLTTPREYVLRLSHLAQRAAIANLHLDKPDLIHAHFAYPVGAAAVELSRRWRVPLVLTLHGDDVTIHPHVSKWHRRRFSRTVHSANSVIAVSRSLAVETESLSGRYPHVLSVGIDPLRFKNLPDQNEMRKRYAIPEDAFVVLYVGSLLLQKGVVDLAGAFNRLGSERTRLLLVGDGPIKLTGKRIIHVGTQPNRDIPKFLAMADVLVLPSHHEGLGQVILEAGAAEIPVVGSATGGIVDLLSEKRGWLFPPKQIYKLTEAIQKVRKYRDEAKRRTMRLKKHVMENHVIQTNAGHLMNIYDNLHKNHAD